MSAGAAPWRVTRLADNAVDLEIAEPCSATALLGSLLSSKAAARRVLARGQLAGPGGPLTAQSQLSEGDAVTLAFWRELSGGVRAAGPVEVVYQDPLLLAVDKPAGLLVHGDGTGAETLTTCVQAHLARQGSTAMPQALQRLDKETTGLVLFSLTEEFQPALDSQVAGHEMHKRYLAVVDGRISGSDDSWVEFDGPIARDRHDAHRMRVGRTGKPSRTLVRTIARQGGRSLLEVELTTGRKHQIRVHLAHAGHPIVGDALYGGKRHADGLMLHAWKERVRHPLTGEWIGLETAVPERFARLFPRLG